MTPKGKAEELIQKFNQADFVKDYGGMDIDLSKQCALILVEDVLNELMFFDTLYASQQNKYWGQVREELLKLS